MKRALGTVLAFVALAAPASAAPPGIGLSGQLAISTWHLPCEVLHVQPMTPAAAAAYGYSLDDTLGFSQWGQARTCTVTVNFPLLRKAGPWQGIDSWARTIRSERGQLRRDDAAQLRQMRRDNRVARERLLCSVLVHEAGHLAGYLDPVGVRQLDGTVDHFHSPNPNNVMYPFMVRDYGPCKRLFPR